MNIFVAFKVYPDLDKLNQNDLIIQNSKEVDLRFLPNTLNCYDESGLELGLRLRDQYAQGGDTPELTAFTVGGEQAELTLNTLKALGYAHTVRAEYNDDDLRFRPDLVADTLSSYLEAHQQQVVILGKEAPLGNSGCVPQLVAVRTGYPLVSNVIHILNIKDDAVVVQVSDGLKIIEQKILLPCILSIGNALVSKLRVPTLRDRMKHRGENNESYAVSPGNNRVRAQLINLSAPNRRRDGYISTLGGQKALEEILRVSLKESLESI